MPDDSPAPTTKEVQTKIWYYSKTIWVNAIFLIALVVQSQAGFIIDPVEQAAVLTVINLILRSITTTGLSE